MRVITFKNTSMLCMLIIYIFWCKLVLWHCMCVFLPLITELISSGAETKKRLLSGGLFWLRLYSVNTLVFDTKVLSLRRWPYMCHTLFKSDFLSHMWGVAWCVYSLPPPFLLLLFPVHKTHKQNRLKYKKKLITLLLTVYIVFILTGNSR